MVVRTPRKQQSTTIALNCNKTTKKIWSTRNQWQRTLPKTSNTREEGRPAIHWTSAIILRDTVHIENNPARRAFYRRRLELSASAVLSRELVPINPTASSFPSRLIPPSSPLLDERRGGNWYNVANQRQRERRGNPGRAAPRGLNCHTPRSPGGRHGAGLAALRGPWFRCVVFPHANLNAYVLTWEAAGGQGLVRCPDLPLNTHEYIFLDQTPKVCFVLFVFLK